jgi:hypothetical protein
VHCPKRKSIDLLLVASLSLAAGGWVRVMGQQATKPVSASGAAASLDFEFFKTKVQPIFLAKRPGHARCVACHGGSNRGIQLQALAPGSTTWNEAESRKNFEAAQKVVVPGSLKSPLLMHPLAEAAGGDFFHSGGKHFNSQSDPEWQTLKTWVMGAKTN